MASLRARTPGSVLGLLKLIASGDRVNPASFGLPQYPGECIEVASQSAWVGPIGAKPPVAASVLPNFGCEVEDWAYKLGSGITPIPGRCAGRQLESPIPGIVSPLL